ncbi:T9SS type A sorting domain-containing protein [Mangrovimonas sp. AS39]|uniref:T9SS type A sorting domain-containing protein n=1 Tax=Mangrovimonas futianensis TaxID=2895523 RepID=UPI001E34D30F|nr:T9SS type A sorting domain-containing protein [Mangrovimonas futianensis]MCF1191970.1 T9SS type A sorting domain-containing protein [Mangrovimonas futianensis]MCF1195664.1 T9SS type A sorting domain-containing protein [Mangrovimonas futianensis]
MKRFTLLCLAVLGLTFSYSIYAQNQCEFKLVMIDSYGDGWNGNTIDVLVDGTVVLDHVQLYGNQGGGYSYVVYFPVTDGSQITTIWNGGGYWPGEVSYKIYDNNNTLLGSGDSAHQINIENSLCYVPLSVSMEESCYTVYKGYVPTECVDLSVNVGGGSSNYNILWSTGETTQTISVCPSEATAYSVSVTDGNETINETATVLVVDVVCSNNVNNGKVLVCHVDEEGNYSTLCVSANAVENHLAHGDLLGGCDSITCNTPPACDITLVSPLNEAVDTSINQEISWTAASGIVDGYYVSIGTTSGGTDVLDGFDVGNILNYDGGSFEYNTTYFITITPYNVNGTANDCMTYSFTTMENPCYSALPIGCEETILGSTVGAPINEGLYCDYNDLGQSGGVWYTYQTNDPNIKVTVDTDGSGYDTRLGLFKGNCDALECVDADNDAGEGLNSKISFDAEVGVLYYIYVTGDNSEGDYNLNVSCLDTSPVMVSCGTTLNNEYCYSDNDTTMFTYTSSEGLPLELVVNTGYVENNWDEFIVLDSDGVTQLYNGYGNYGSLAGLTFVSTGDTISVMIQSDSSTSCSTRGYVSLNYDINCFVPCGYESVETYCYGNNENNQFSYISTDGSPVHVAFMAGSIETYYDELRILDSDGTTVLFNSNSPYTTNLSEVSVESTGDTIFFDVSSDVSVSCGSGSRTQWEYLVSWGCPNDQIASSRFATPLKTELLNQEDWSLYPNPTNNGQVTLRLDKYINQSLEIKVLDVTGKVVYVKDINALGASKFELALSHIPSGMYFVTITHIGEVSTKKLIVK